MIVLDEQLLGRGLEIAIARWSPGSVVFITINETDFWQRVAITEHFCVICFALTDAQAGQITVALQRLLRHKRFRNKSLRCGMVIRVTAVGIQFYTTEDRTPRTLEDW